MSILKRAIKIVTLIAAIIFINTIFSLHSLSEFSNWNQKTKNILIKKIYNLPIRKLKPFSLAGSKSEHLVGRLSENSEDPNSAELFFFSPFSKNPPKLGFIKNTIIPIYWDFHNATVIENRGDSEFPQMGVKNKEIRFKTHDIEGNVLRNLVLENLSIPVPNDLCGTGIINIIDIDGDDRKDLIWRIECRFAGMPRGIAVHDPYTGGKKWEFLFGAIPSQVVTKDINGDGNKEILFSAWAPHNNISFNGMSDDTSYVGVLDSTGGLIWSKAAGGIYTHAYMAVEDLDNNGTFEIVTARSCHADVNPDPGKIKVYDAMTGGTINSIVKPGLSFKTIFVANINEDRNLEIITSDDSGWLHIWDKNLNVIAQYKDEANIRVLGVEKIGSYPHPHIFTYASFNRLQVFNGRLKTVFFHQFPKNYNHPETIVPVSDGSKVHFILTTDKTFLISHKGHRTLQDYLALFRSNFSLYFLGIVLFNILVYVGWRQVSKTKRFYLSLLQDGTESNSGWTVTVQDVLHKMKSPLTAILWATEKIGQLVEKKPQPKTLPSRLKKINDAILEDVKDIKLMNRYLMKFLQLQNQRLQEIEIEEILSELVKKYHSIFGNKFSFTASFSTPVPSFIADEEQLAEAFSIVIDNAIDAMPMGGTISMEAIFIKALPVNKQRNIICVLIEDNGYGIPEDKLEKIFEPYYSTKKEGTGIGLAIARRITESHGGWLEVESREGIGTKVAFYFPATNFSQI